MADQSQLSIELATALKSAGLKWQPALHDFFTIPGTEFDDRQFVLADMMASMSVLKGYPAITFNGVVEWALDYVFQQDALWLPTEAQLRDQIDVRINGDLVLRRSAATYTCEITIAEAPLTFTGNSASNAYARALLNLLQFD